jgi:hypothetical protein
MNMILLLIIIGLVYVALQQKKVSTRNVILVVTGLIAFCMMGKEGFGGITFNSVGADPETTETTLDIPQCVAVDPQDAAAADWCTGISSIKDDGDSTLVTNIWPDESHSPGFIPGFQNVLPYCGIIGGYEPPDGKMALPPRRMFGSTQCAAYASGYAIPDTAGGTPVTPLGAPAPWYRLKGNRAIGGGVKLFQGINSGKTPETVSILRGRTYVNSANPELTNSQQKMSAGATATLDDSTMQALCEAVRNQVAPNMHTPSASPVCTYKNNTGELTEATTNQLAIVAEGGQNIYIFNRDNFSIATWDPASATGGSPNVIREPGCPGGLVLETSGTAAATHCDTLNTQATCNGDNLCEWQYSGVNLATGVGQCGSILNSSNIDTVYSCPDDETNEDCVVSWEDCSSACEPSADRISTGTTGPSGSGAACSTIHAPSCSHGDHQCTTASAQTAGTTFGTDCAGSWSPCTTLCEEGSARHWTTTTAAANRGKPCPLQAQAPDCAYGVDACVISDATLNQRITRGTSRSDHSAQMQATIDALNARIAQITTQTTPTTPTTQTTPTPPDDTMSLTDFWPVLIVLLAVAVIWKLVSP